MSLKQAVGTKVPEAYIEE